MTKIRREIQQEHARALLLVDGHSSRGDIATLKLLAENCIDVLTLESHSSHLLQPLDQTCNNKLKYELKSRFYTEEGLDASTRREKLLLAASYALAATFIKDTIQNG